MAITVRECTYDEVAKFRNLEGDYHHMGESHVAGDTIRLVFEEDGVWIALQTWAAACYRLKPRDLEIGWNRAMCAKRLKLIASNRRFTILGRKGARPNLASQVLGIGTVLTLFTMGVAARAHDLKAAHAYAETLTDEQLRQVGCARKRDALGNPIEGKYACPSWMTAQAGKLPRHLTIGGKFIREIVGLVSLVDAESGDVVAVAPASKKEGIKGRGSRPRPSRRTCSGTPRNSCASS